VKNLLNRIASYQSTKEDIGPVLNIFRIHVNNIAKEILDANYELVEVTNQYIRTTSLKAKKKWDRVLL
jgi:hypothetical protein